MIGEYIAEHSEELEEYLSDLDTESDTLTPSEEISEKLDTIIEGEQAIHNVMWLIIGMACVTIVIKFLWTILAKWFFGGV